MTALAAAPASGPIAPAAPRAPPQPQADRFAFAVVLDSLPGAQTRAGASTAEGQPHSSKEPGQEESARGQPARHSPLNDSSLLASLPFALRASSNELGQGESTLGQPARHSLLNDSALLASLPFALRASSMGGQGPRAADDSPSPKTPTMKGPKSEDNGSSPAAGAKAATVGRLVGERAFHFGASPSPGVITSRALPVDRPFAPASVSDANPTSRPDLSGKSALAAGFPGLEAMPAKPFSDDVPSGDSAPAPAPIAPRAGTPPTNRVSPTRSAGHDATRSGRKAEVSAPPPRPGLRARLRPPRHRNRAATASLPAITRPIQSRPRRRRRRRQVRLAHSSLRLSSPARRSDPMPRRREPQTQTSRARARLAPARRPPLRQSRRSTSICRREASRTSR